jgi:hypothetical protein
MGNILKAIGSCKLVEGYGHYFDETSEDTSVVICPECGTPYAQFHPPTMSGPPRQNDGGIGLDQWDLLNDETNWNWISNFTDMLAIPMSGKCGSKWYIRFSCFTGVPDKGFRSNNPQTQVYIQLIKSCKQPETEPLSDVEYLEGSLGTLVDTASSTQNVSGEKTEDKELYDTSSAADFLGLSVDQLRRRVRAQTITPSFRSRNTFLWSHEDLLKAKSILAEPLRVSGKPDSLGKMMDGKELLRVMGEQGWRQSDVAQMMAISPTVVNRWVRGKTGISPRKAKELRRLIAENEKYNPLGEPEDY